MRIFSVGSNVRGARFSVLVPASAGTRWRTEVRHGTLKRAPQAGVTLIEMLVVAGLIAILAGISFPAATAGLDGLRLNSATDSIVSFLNAGLNRAERRQQVVEITILAPERTLAMRSSEPGFTRRLLLPEGISIVGIHPEIAVEPGAPRSFLLYPGGVVPRIGIEVANRRHNRRIVRVDPITGVPLIEPL